MSERQRGTIVTTLPSALTVWSDDAALHLELVDGRELTVPLAWIPRLLNATPEQRSRWELIGQGEGIHWEELDEDVSVASLLGLLTD